MRIYTRYRSSGKRRPWWGAARLLLAAAGLGTAGYIIQQHLQPPDDPVTQGPAAPPAETKPSPSILPPPGPPSAGAALRNTNPVPLLPLPAAPRVAPTNPPRPAPPAESAPPPSTNAPIPVTPISPTAPFLAPRPVENILEAQIALARQAISSGSIDGANGYQTRAALRAFQTRERIPPTGTLDLLTRSRLRLELPPLTNYVVVSNDLARLRPVPSTWLGKSQQPRLDYSTLIELAAERCRAHPALLRKLNPGVSWGSVTAGQILTVPNVPPPVLPARLAFLQLRLRDRILCGYDLRTNLLLQFPCSIAARVEKRPLGRLEVVVIARDPAYTFNPEVFPESAEGRRLGRKLTIPPGPNNPVGVAWIGLSRPGYGIHGTPRPEEVGRTESHGCFRLANWDAEVLVQLVWRGLPVYVLP